MKRNLMTKKKFTHFFDDWGHPIYEGDKLYSEWDFYVIVCCDENDHFYGKLVCNDDHSCKDIPYDLSDGRGFVIIRS